MSSSTGRRKSWDETWMLVAQAMSHRSACTRRQVGAVIVSTSNRIIASSYNGPPAGFPGGNCGSVCPRGRGDVDAGSSYESCISLHAEANGLMFNDRSDSIGGTIYVTSLVCNQCALLIANSGLKRVVMLVDEVRDAHRNPNRTMAILLECGLEVIVNYKRYGGYRRIFYDAYGPGPHNCHYCSDRMPYVEIVHHLDENRKNNHPDNLVSVHEQCHALHHSEDRIGKKRGKYQAKRETKQKCPNCDMMAYAGPLGRHRKAKGH